MKLLEQDKKTLEHEINGYRQEAQKQRKIIQQLEKERDRYINETSSLMQKAGSAEELAYSILLFGLIDSDLKLFIITRLAYLPSSLPCLWWTFLLSTGATENEWRWSKRDGDIWLEEEGHRGRV